MNAPDYYLLHAYSSHNSGDGLLVKLSLKAIRDAGITRTITVVCLDKESFAGYIDDANIRLISLGEFLRGRFLGVFLRQRSVYFGVGGGYLRASSRPEGWKSLIAHGSQILMSSFGGSSRRIYFPQSVGPFDTFAGKLLARIVRSRVERIFLRDDKSVSELAHPAATRTGDLVVLEIAQEAGAGTLRHTRIAVPQVYLVFRDLQNKPYRNAYLERVHALMTLLPDAKLAIQARGRGNSDDVFYREHLGVDNAAMLKDVLAERSAIVVSVRLHGSLESVLAGVPSVHIAYERKGHAAFGDLGLDDFVFHASDFDPIAVANAVRLLVEDEEQYWVRVESNVQRSHEHFVEAIKDELRTFDNADHGR
ncbi:polysaccharide pyruvyl transferase family protein [uncultured Caballeronia sp.]|uniref:polysaccharide pyruvyl transferase family protein n=1 Tax=uncultured Caballeronia sp. TaxID=1827198 RepID=UPI0035CB77A7